MVESLEKIEYFLSSNEQLTWEEVAWLESMSKKYPYFQTLHVWIAKHYLKEEHLLKNHKIQTASVFSVDRNLLKKRLLENNISKNPIKKEPSSDNVIFAKINHYQPVKEKTREELLAAVEERLKELNANKKSILTNNPSKPEPKEVENKASINENILEIDIPRPTKKGTSKIKKGENKEIEAKKTTPSELKKEKEKADEELKKIISDSIKPKDLFYSRLGNELNIESSDSIDLLLNYLESQKERKLNNSNPKNVDFIVQNFIKNDPKISKLKPNQKEEGEDLTTNLYSNKKFISENLAKIQAKQGYTKEAIEIYEELILKYPEKKNYFATQIKKLK